MPVVTTEEIELQISAGNGAGIPALDGGEGGDGESPAYRRASVTGITLALGGILMFFLALASSYIVRRGVTTDWQAFPLPRVLYANTAILLASSITIEMAKRALARGESAAFRNLWALTSGLGLIFVAGQLLAWRELRTEGVFLATNPSSSFFYVLTALHGLHLLGGIIALAYVGLRSWRGSKIGQKTGAGVAAIYWHFMDGLWVFLLLLLTLGR